MTSYDYSIKTDNPDLGFDVYFVSSSVQKEDDAISSMNFGHYKEPGCFGQNKQSYSGTCNGVKKDSGLLVLFPDEFEPWITKVIVNLYEKK